MTTIEVKEAECEHEEQDYVPVAHGEGEEIIRVCAICDQELDIEDPAELDDEK